MGAAGAAGAGVAVAAGTVAVAAAVVGAEGGIDPPPDEVEVAVRGTSEASTVTVAETTVAVEETVVAVPATILDVAETAVAVPATDVAVPEMAVTVAPTSVAAAPAVDAGVSVVSAAGDEDAAAEASGGVAATDPLALGDELGMAPGADAVAPRSAWAFGVVAAGALVPTGPPAVCPLAGAGVAVDATDVGARVAGASETRFPIVVPVADSFPTTALRGSPRAASTAVMPLIATRKPTTATAEIVTTAPRENMPSMVEAAVGEVTTVLSTPSLRSWRREMPAWSSRRSTPASGVLTSSLTADPTVAPIIAPISVPCVPK